MKEILDRVEATAGNCFHQTLGISFGLNFSKSPSITASPTWVFDQSYDQTAYWSYYE